MAVTSSNAALDPAVINTLNGNAAAAAARKVQDPSEDLRNNFMTLLVTQLQNQDPLKPMENAELTSQLAQINTVSGINSLNDTLDGITNQIEAGQSLQAAGLIGSGVLVAGDRVLVGENGASTPFGVELDAPVYNLKAKILGANGEELKTIELGAVNSGVRAFTWDGTLNGGEVAEPGSYRVLLEGTDRQGEPLATGTLQYAVVHGITTGGSGGVKLDLGGLSEPIGMDDVRQIL